MADFKYLLNRSSKRKAFSIFGYLLMIILIVISIGPQIALSKQKTRVVVAGAGPSTQVVELFMGMLSKKAIAKNYTFRVPKRSIKHAGGLNVASKYIIGRTGRPLNSKEKSQGFEEIFLSKIPIAFVSGRKTGVHKLSINQVCGIFTGKIKNWAELGGNNYDIIILGRETTEALFLTLKKKLACMNHIIDTKYIYKKDHAVLNALTKSGHGNYAIGFGARTYFPARYLINIPDFDAGVSSGLVYKISNRDHPVIVAAKELAKSKEWEKALKNNNLSLPDN